MGTWTLWLAFNVVIIGFLLADLALFQRIARASSLRKAALESGAWVGISVAFGAWIYVSHGREPGLQFFAGYVIEKSLSLDNVFVFWLIFRYFRVESRYQHRLLFWGVLGALVMRGAMIGLGLALIARFEWVLYLFGAFVIYAGFKLLAGEHEPHPESNPIIRWVRKLLPIAPEPAGGALVVRSEGRWSLTPLFLVVVAIEISDLLLATDSIPAVFGVTRDPFLVYTSNVCAILGLRAFYFLLAGMLPLFRFLDEGLGVVLIFIGAKMLADPWVHVSTGLSLMVIAGIIGTAIVFSVARARN